MLGKIIFGIATLCFVTSLFVDAVTIGDQSRSGIAAFFSTLRHGTAGVVNPSSLSSFIVHFIALIAAAANFVFVFWAMLVFSPTRITLLKWFWWLSLLFMLAAVYTGIQVMLNEQVGLRYGYGLWLSSLVLMLLAPVVSRFERMRKKRKSNAVAMRQNVLDDATS